jgi:hypothetical protein
MAHGYALLIQYWNGSHYSPNLDWDGITVYRSKYEAMAAAAKIENKIEKLERTDIKVDIIKAEIK